MKFRVLKKLCKKQIPKKWTKTTEGDSVLYRPLRTEKSCWRIWREETND